MKRISPSHAANVGLAWIVLPSLLLFAGPMAGSIYSIENMEYDWGIPEPLVVVSGFAIGLVLAFAWWIFMIMPWRLWAFSRVSDPVELHAFAVAWYILHEDTHSGFGKFSESVIFASPEQRVSWDLLEQGINNSENFLLKERFIYYSPFKMLWWSVFLILFACFGLYLVSKNPDDMQEMGTGLIFVIGVSFMLFVPSRLNDRFPIQKRLAALRQKEPRLRISRLGMSIARDQLGFIEWSGVKRVSILKNDDKVSGVILTLETENGIQKVELDASEWAISPSYLARLIQKAHQHFSDTQTNEAELG